MNEDDKIIWRYMNPYIFISQLIRKEFLFVRITRMEDRTETQLKQRSFYECIVPGGRNKKSFERERTESLDKIKENTADHYISSWTSCEYENLFFWQNFASKFGGIAIKSTAGKFFKNISISNTVIGRPIKYYPFQNQKFSLDPFSIEDRVFSKYKDFSFEQEYRFSIYYPNSMLQGNENDFISIAVDFNNIIDNFIISPLMKKTDYQYFLDTIKEIDATIIEKNQISAFSYLQ